MPHDSSARPASVPPPATTAPAPFAPTGIRLDGRLVGLFSFDLGAEIDLARARTLVAAGTDDPTRRRAAPPYVGHATRPVRAPLGTRDLVVDGAAVRAEASLVVHEVGAITILLTTPLACDAASLPRLTATLTSAGSMEDAARGLAEDVRARLAPAVTKPAPSALVEDYYVVHVERLEPEVTVPDLLARARAPLAAALRCEAEPLSEREMEDTLRPGLSYFPDDLALMDWNVAILVDPEAAATIEVLEYLNVQLLELRYFDTLLERQLGESYDAATTRAAPLPLWNSRLQRTLDELGTVRLEVTGMVARLHNAFKVGGDVYLAKLYTRTAERLGIAAWEASVQGKLDVLQERYAVLLERVRTARSELLEMAIIVLFLIELVVLVGGWG